MKPRLYSAVLLAAVLAGGAQAADHAMEHVEVIGYPAPKMAEQVAEGKIDAAQLAKQQRQELLQHLQKSLRKQLAAVRREDAIAGEETAARESLHQQQGQLVPAGAESVPVKLEQPPKLEQKAGERQPAQEAEGVDAQQEPS